MFDSFTWYSVLVLAALYVCTFCFRLVKLVWAKGALQEEVYPGDAVLIVLRDIWKLVYLPIVAVKAALAWKAKRV